MSLTQYILERTTDVWREGGVFESGLFHETIHNLAARGKRVFPLWGPLPIKYRLVSFFSIKVI